METKPKYCLMCEDLLYISRTHGSKKRRRRPADLTCSPKCSKLYNRLVQKIRSKYEKRISLLKKELEEAKKEVKLLKNAKDI